MFARMWSYRNAIISLVGVWNTKLLQKILKNFLINLNICFLCNSTLTLLKRIESICSHKDLDTVFKASLFIICPK